VNCPNLTVMYVLYSDGSIHNTLMVSLAATSITVLLFCELFLNHLLTMLKPSSNPNHKSYSRTPLSRIAESTQKCNIIKRRPPSFSVGLHSLFRIAVCPYLHSHLGISDSWLGFLQLQWCGAKTVTISEEVHALSFPNGTF
jgi:hypothetical protein